MFGAVPARAAPLILNTTLRHLRLVDGFNFTFTIWLPGLAVAVAVACLPTQNILDQYRKEEVIKLIRKSTNIYMAADIINAKLKKYRLYNKD